MTCYLLLHNVHVAQRGAAFCGLFGLVSSDGNNDLSRAFWNFFLLKVRTLFHTSYWMSVSYLVFISASQGLVLHVDHVLTLTNTAICRWCSFVCLWKKKTGNLSVMDSRLPALCHSWWNYQETLCVAVLQTASYVCPSFLSLSDFQISPFSGGESDTFLPRCHYRDLQVNWL